jgi:hypothetical protein
MIIITPNTQLIYFSAEVGSAGTAPSTAASFDVGGPIVAQTSGTRLFWPKKKYEQFLAAEQANEAARTAGMTPLQKIDDAIAKIDAQLASVPENLRPEYAANARRAKLVKDRSVAERDEKVRALAEEIKARRAIDALKR